MCNLSQIVIVLELILFFKLCFLPEEIKNGCQRDQNSYQNNSFLVISFRYLRAIGEYDFSLFMRRRAQKGAHA